VRILGGSFEGERLRGTIREVGADWQTIRADGTMELDVRCLLETSTGDLIHLRGAGLRHGPPEVIARMSKGEDVDPASYYFREVTVHGCASAVIHRCHENIDIQKTYII